MAIVAMQKVQIYTHINKVQEILRCLQTKAIIEITDIDEDFLSPTALTQIQAKDLEEILIFLKTLFPKTPSFMENFIQIKELPSPEQMRKLLKNMQELKVVLKKIHVLQEQWNVLRADENELTSKIFNLELYKHFTLKLGRLTKVSRVKFIFGYYPLTNYKRWQEKGQLPGAELQETVLSQDSKHIYLAYCFFPELETDLRQAVSVFGFSEVALPEGKGDFSEQLAKAQGQLREKQKILYKLENQLKSYYRENKLLLSVWYDHLQNEEKIALCSHNLLETKKVALIEGWIIKSRYAELRTLLDPFEKDTFVKELPNAVDDIPPVVIQNKLTAPFESVTLLYGLPNANEFDPTPYLAPFFIVYYGLCLSDAGYGLMLLLTAQVILHVYFKQLTSYGKKLLTMNTYCGLSTIIVGTVTGSYFGIDLNVIPFPALKQLLLNLRIIDSVKNPLPMLIMAVCLGIVQIYTGLIVRWIIDIKQKGAREAFLVSGLWVYFATGLVLWPLFNNFIFNPMLALLGKIIVYTGMIALILTQGKHHKNPIMRLMSGVLSLYRLTGYVGDILSYTRLFALGLVTSVLAMVINYLAAMAGGIPVVGIVVMIAILIFGHTFDFLINILGSFVHSARLQYVEYFTKFFEGGGKAFKPFIWQTKYIKVKE